MFGLWHATTTSPDTPWTKDKVNKGQPEQKVPVVLITTLKDYSKRSVNGNIMETWERCTVKLV